MRTPSPIAAALHAEADDLIKLAWMNWQSEPDLRPQRLDAAQVLRERAYEVEKGLAAGPA